ncbi:Gfo/Idh/MocA family protein [Candidatus Zixiibacteriota bacterium]
MDYLEQPFGFKVKKVLRYLSLYGINRTFYKVRGQLHLRRKYDSLPPRTRTGRKNQFIGLIGCGNYAFTTVAYFLTRQYGRVIGGCMDIDLNRAASLAEHFKIPSFTINAEEIIGNDSIKLVYIASNHATHAEYAIRALNRGKHVYIEKPPVVSEDQLSRLIQAMRESPGKVFLGFNRPGSRFGRIIRQYLNDEQGPGIYNWFVAGHDIDPDHWYFQPAEGGRILGNLCHWTDFILRLAGPHAFPVEIAPTRAATSDTNVAMAYHFAEGTIAVITFSAQGHIFEGVKERFSAHKGNCLLTMDDFKTLQIELIDKKLRWRNFHRDHGHRQNIIAAAENVINEQSYDREEQLTHIQRTGLLFLKTKTALEQNKRLVVEEYAPTKVFV